MSKSLKNCLHKDWWLKYVPFILLGAVICLLILHTATSLVEWYCQWDNPRDLDYAEGWHAYVAAQSYPGGDHVGSSYEMPYNTLPYPPISYLFHGWIGKLVGTDLVGVRTIGRTTSLIMTLLNSIIIFLIGQAIGVRFLWSAIAAIHSLKARGGTDFRSQPVVELLRRTEEPILADQAWLYFQSGHQPFVSPPDLIMAAVEGGKIDGRPMQEFIENQGFNTIVVRQNWKERRHFPQAWISAIEENYETLSGDYGYIVMKPKTKS